MHREVLSVHGFTQVQLQLLPCYTAVTATVTNEPAFVRCTATAGLRQWTQQLLGFEPRLLELVEQAAAKHT